MAKTKRVMLAELRGLCQRKLPGIVSEYFSIGSLKGVTHPDLWKGSKEELLLDLTSKSHLFGTLAADCAIVAVKLWLAACQQLVKEIINTVNGWADSSDFYLNEKDPLIKRYKMLRWPNNGEDFGGCPNTETVASRLGWSAALGVAGLRATTKQNYYFPVPPVLNLPDMLVDMRCRAGDGVVRIEAWRCSEPDQEWRLPATGFDSRSTERTKLWSNVLAFAYQHKPEVDARAIASGLMKRWGHFPTSYGRMFVRKETRAVECVSLGATSSLDISSEQLERIVRPPEGKRARQAFDELVSFGNLWIFLVWQVWEEEPPAGKSAGPSGKSAVVGGRLGGMQ